MLGVGVVQHTEMDTVALEVVVTVVVSEPLATNNQVQVFQALQILAVAVAAETKILVAQVALA